MSIFVCPPSSSPVLDPNQIVPHPGFGSTALYRNGQWVWESYSGEWWEDPQPIWTIKQLTEWCPVRQGIGWKLEINGPMKYEIYRLHDGVWRLVKTGLGFA